MKKLILLFCLLPTVYYTQKTYVPDDIFEAYIESRGWGDGIPNNDSVSTASISAVASLIYHGGGISDFTGIQDFTNIIHFWCDFNAATHLDLSQNFNLNYINFSDSPITSVNFGQITQVNEFHCRRTNLISLDISNWDNPYHIYIEHNDFLTCVKVGSHSGGLSSCRFYDCPNLNCILMDDPNLVVSSCGLDSTQMFSTNCNYPNNCFASFSSSNNKTYIPDDNFEVYLEANNMGDGIANNDSVLTANIDTVGTIDVSSQNITDLTGIEDFSALTRLYCSGNQLANLDVSNNTALTILDCGYNQLGSIDVSNNTALESLSCRYNQLTHLDVSANTAIEYLLCNNNQLTSLDLAQNNNLIWLYCDDNNLTNLDVSENTSLEILSCQLNQLTSLDVSENTSLTYLDCLNNQLTCLNVKNGNNINLISIQNPNLNCIEVDDPNWSNQNWTAANGNIDNGVTFSLNCNYPSGCFQSSSNGSGPKTYIPDDNFEAYLEANNMGDGIANNDSVFTANINGVVGLNVNNQNISTLEGIQSFSNLTSLSCKNNSLTSLDISQNTNLYSLNCRYNQISSLDVTQNTALVSLIINDNEISSIDITQNTSLEHFGCEDNQISSVDVSNNTSLVYFICGDNQITSLDVSNNTALKYLGFHANQISSIDVSNNTLLEVLSFGRNQVSTLDVSNNTSLIKLRCHLNQLTSLDVSANTNLTQLYCSYNPLTCLNMKNGNNTNISSFNATNNSSLNCIEVDNPTWSTSNWNVSNNNIDSAVIFSTSCSYPSGCF